MAKTTGRWVALGCAVALAACSSTVVRQSAPTARAPARPVSTPKPGASVVVQRGDTLFGLAFRNGVSVTDLASWNGLSAPYTIYPGQRLRLSPRTTASRPPAPSRPADRPGTARGGVAPAAPRTPPSRPAGEVRTVPPATPPADSGIVWRWPADGTLLARFVSGEPTRQGIDIGGTAGTPVRAAADGTVVYSGAGLVGYGELVIVKHSDAWLSAYGHNRKRLVNEGELVRAGQQIAEMGRSGAPRDMLHFEIRYNGRPVDPLLHLPAR